MLNVSRFTCFYGNSQELHPAHNEIYLSIFHQIRIRRTDYSSVFHFVLTGGGVLIPGGGAWCLRLLGDLHQALGRASLCHVVSVRSREARINLYRDLLQET
jgi:hypothetical protein